MILICIGAKDTEPKFLYFPLLNSFTVFRHIQIFPVRIFYVYSISTKLNIFRTGVYSFSNPSWNYGIWEPCFEDYFVLHPIFFYKNIYSCIHKTQYKNYISLLAWLVWTCLATSSFVISWLNWFDFLIFRNASTFLLKLVLPLASLQKIIKMPFLFAQ